MSARHRLDRIFTEKVKGRIELYVLILNLLTLVLTVMGMMFR